MTTEVHHWRGRDWYVRDGIFEYDGLKFYVRSGSAGKADAGIVTNCVDHDGFSYWRHSPFTGVVIDVGAHIGGFTCAVARTAKHVYAYEAVQETFNLLVRNVALNSLDNVTCQRAAAGGGGEVTIRVHQHGMGSFLHSDRFPGEVVAGISLRGMLSGLGEVNLMKVDCEGSEYDLLLNQPKELIRQVQVYSMEIHTHPSYNHEELFSYLVSCGYGGEMRASYSDTCKMTDLVRQ